MTWFDQLQPASFRGVPFAVLGSNMRFGRRNAVHQYPYRDTIFIEDMGRSAREIGLVGFLVGDDVISQRETLIAAVETEDSGELIHPTLGSLNVSLLNLSTDERWDEGQYFELGFSFLEAGERIFPSVGSSTQDAVAGAASDAMAAFSGDFITSIGSAISSGALAVQQAVSTAQGFVDRVNAVVGDARLITGAVAGLVSPSGTFGRYSLGGRIGLQDVTQTVSGVLSDITAARSVVAQTGSDLVDLAGAL